MLPFPITWNTVIEQIIEDKYFNAEEKKGLINSVTTLKELLGEEILNHYHPIHEYIFNTAPWTRMRLKQMADSLHELKFCGNFNSIIKRLKLHNNFTEAVSVLDIAISMKRAGFEITFDAKVNVKGKEKEPDLLLHNPETNEQIYTEVTKQHQSYEEKESSRTFEQLQGLFMYDPELIYKTDCNMKCDR